VVLGLTPVEFKVKTEKYLAIEGEKKYMDTDIVKKRVRIALPILGFMAFLFLVFAIYVMFIGKFSSNAIGGGIILILIGMIPAYGIKRIRTIIPPEPADILAVGKYGTLSTWHWYNQSGVWKNNKKIFAWSDVSDIFIMRTWTETSTPIKTYTIADAAAGKPSTYTFGLVRFVMKNGKYIDIDRVVDPEKAVSFIKKMYLKSSL